MDDHRFHARPARLVKPGTNRQIVLNTNNMVQGTPMMT
jgi:hypothetical protein